MAIKSKVIFQKNRETDHRPFMEHTGICSLCGAIVSRNQYGCDEECECGTELDWSGEE